MAATSKHGTVTAPASVTVTLRGLVRGWRVTNRTDDGGPDLWYTWGFNEAPTVAVEGDDTYYLPAGAVDREEDAQYLASKHTGGAITSLVFNITAEDTSTGIVHYSVETW